MPRNSRSHGIHHHRARTGRHHGHFGHGHIGRTHKSMFHSSLHNSTGFGHGRTSRHLGRSSLVPGRLLGRSTISPMDMMVLNQMTSPLSTSMVNAPITNYYGTIGTPGGVRALISSPAESVSSTANSVSSSAVNYPPEPRYSQNEQYQSLRRTPNQPPVGFEGVQPQINPAPSFSNVTLDYQVTSAAHLRPLGDVSDGQIGPYIDHFPQPGRFTPDSMSYIHQAPPAKRRRRRRRRDPGDEDGGCCVLS